MVAILERNVLIKITLSKYKNSSLKRILQYRAHVLYVGSKEIKLRRCTKLTRNHSLLITSNKKIELGRFPFFFLALNAQLLQGQLQ